MRRAVWFLLPASRVLAICAGLAGAGAGFLMATIVAALTCLDSCPTREGYFSNLGSVTIRMMTPFVALGLLALVTFVAHCVATRQARRAVRPTLVLLVGSIASVVTFDAVMLLGQASLPITQYGALEERPLELWASLWGLALMGIAIVWSAILARAQWVAK